MKPLSERFEELEALATTATTFLFPGGHKYTGPIRPVGIIRQTSNDSRPIPKRKDGGQSQNYLVLADDVPLDVLGYDGDGSEPYPTGIVLVMLNDNYDFLDWSPHTQTLDMLQTMGMPWCSDGSMEAACAENTGRFTWEILFKPGRNRLQRRSTMLACSCGNSKIVDTATTCPDCGAPLAATPSSPGAAAGAAVVGVEASPIASPPSLSSSVPQDPPPTAARFESITKGREHKGYQAQISRQNPSCILFLIDQSRSMSDPMGGQSARSKADQLADAVNRLLYELAIRCTKSHSEGIRNYYDVGVLGYGEKVGAAWGGSLAGRGLVPISEVGDHPAKVDERKRRVEDGVGGLVEETVKMPLWFFPMANNGTPMCEALRQSETVLRGWVSSHQSSFPPIVINITDGEATDGEPLAAAESLKRLATDDGNVLLFNLHLSSRTGASIQYPESESVLPDEFAVQLFRMSSVLPPHVQTAITAEGYPIGSQARGFVFNAGIVEVIKFLNIGTQAKELR